MITPDQARAELARRELARRELARREQAQTPQEPQKPRAGFKEFAFGGAPGFSLMPGAEDVLPAVGQTMGGLGGSYPGSVAGATAGQVARQAVKGVRGEGFKFGEIPAEAARTATIEGLFRGAGKLVRPIANRLMTSIIKPGRAVLEKSPKLGIEAVEAGITGTRGQMTRKSGQVIEKGEADLKKLLGKSPQKVNLKNVVAELGEMKRRAANVGDDATLKQIDDFEKFILSKGEMIKGQPIETSQFVMRGPSTKVGAPRPSTSIKPVFRAGKKNIPEATRKEFLKPGRTNVTTKVYDPSTGIEIPIKTEKNIPGRRIVTPNKYIERPEDIVTLHRPGKGEAVIYPKKSIEILPEIKGVSRKLETETPTYLLGSKEANQLKRDFYQQISDPQFSKKVSDLAENPEMKRRAAKGLRKEIIGGIPQAEKLDKLISTGIKTKKGLEQEEARSLARVVLPFFEVGGAGLALSQDRPDLAALIAARRLAMTPFGMSTMARTLLSQGLGKGARFGASEVARRFGQS